MKTIKVEVARSSSTELYVDVPDDFDPKRLYGWEWQKELGRIASETTTDGDWDDYGWAAELEVHQVVETTAEEAAQYCSGVLDISNRDARFDKPTEPAITAEPTLPGTTP